MARSGSIRRVGVLTGGGDCPGLNAVIRAVTKDALHHGFEVIGICDGYLGLIENRTRRLGADEVAGIVSEGGTILGSSNKANPFQFAVGKDDSGRPIMRDVSEKALATIRDNGIDALAVIGGDGTMTIAKLLADRSGTPIVGIPKTIDNDLYGTELTFGFLTAVSIATEALDRVHTTAQSHQRAMVVEVMGRNAGWIALYAGIAGSADVILLPEIPFNFETIARTVRERSARGRCTIICVSEGARPLGGEKIVARVDPTSPDPIRLGGIGKFVSEKLETMTGVESRYVVLGHVQRGGTPVASDRVLGTQFGHQAMCVLRSGKTNRMVAMRNLGSGGESGLTDIDLSEPAGKQRLVPVAGQPGGEGEFRLLAAARSVDTRFGDEL